MSKIGVTLKIDVTKIDKARLFVGKKGKYLDATVFIDTAELDQYGNSGMITQDVSKDERAKGAKGEILGNCKVFWSESGQAPQQESRPNGQAANQPQQAQYQKNNPAPTGGGGGYDDFSDDVPFAALQWPNGG